MNAFVLVVVSYVFVFFFKQKTAYEMRISDWSSDVCSSDLFGGGDRGFGGYRGPVPDDYALRHGDAARARTIIDALDVIDGIGGAGEEIGRASCRERVCQYV